MPLGGRNSRIWLVSVQRGGSGHAGQFPCWPSWCLLALRGLGVVLISSHVFDPDKHGCSLPKLLRAQGGRMASSSAKGPG